MTEDELTSEERYELSFDCHLIGEKTRMQVHLGVEGREENVIKQKTDTFPQNDLDLLGCLVFF